MLELTKQLSAEIGVAFGEADLLLMPVLYPVTALLRLGRALATEKVYPFPGDILRYQRDGAPIRSFILQQLYKTNSSVVLAHSLGAIACVDLLASQPVPEVELLIR